MAALEVPRAKRAGIPPSAVVVPDAGRVEHLCVSARCWDVEVFVLLVGKVGKRLVCGRTARENLKKRL